MKWLPWILVALLATTILYRNCNREKEGNVLVIDTVIQIDTVRDTVPQTVLVRFDHWDTIYIPLLIDGDTVDSVPFTIPIEKKEYRTEDYHAIISGYKPKLELMEIFRRTQIITLKTKSKRWGLGLQAGYGADGLYVGVGVSYNIVQW